MRIQIHILLLLALLFLAGGASGASSLVSRDVPAKPATYTDVHALQALGRFIVAPDGTFFLYEWGRPYLNWVPPSDGIAPIAARRLQTFLFKVDITADAPASEYLFEPNPGATYWLGNLSPDSSRVSFYELDRDDNRTRAGVWNLKEQNIRWFDLQADDSRLDLTTPWVSNEEFVYPVKGRTRFARANALTGNASVCPDCRMEAMTKAKATLRKAESEAKAFAAKLDATDLPQGAVLRAGSKSGNLAVFVKDDVEELQLLIKQPGWASYVIFSNSRRWPSSPQRESSK